MKIESQPKNNQPRGVIFTDGTAVYDDLAEVYIRHKTGRFILAPSGSGKTFYVTRQQQNHWIDGDVLWDVTGADYSDPTWGNDTDDVMEINARSDVITIQAKKQGFWVIGSSNLFLKPDAIVIPEWEKHQSYISSRENNNYDGGATSKNLEDLKLHIKWIHDTWAGKVSFFDTIEDAVTYIESKD